MKRFLIGFVTTMGLAFLPLSIITAISVWVFADYDPKFGPYGTWTLSNQVASIIMVAALIGFAITFPLINRFTRNHKMWRYLVTITLPVGVMYSLIFMGFLPWLFALTKADSLAGFIFIGILTYLPGLLAAVGVALYKKSPKPITGTAP